VNRAYKKHYPEPRTTSRELCEAIQQKEKYCKQIPLLNKENCMCTCRREFCGQFAFISTLFAGPRPEAGQFRTLEAKSAQASRTLDKEAMGQKYVPILQLLAFLASSSQPFIHVNSNHRCTRSVQTKWISLDSWQMNGWLSLLVWPTRWCCGEKRFSGGVFFKVKFLSRTFSCCHVLPCPKFGCPSITWSSLCRPIPTLFYKLAEIPTRFQVRGSQGLGLIYPTLFPLQRKQCALLVDIQFMFQNRDVYCHHYDHTGHYKHFIFQKHSR